MRLDSMVGILVPYFPSLRARVYQIAARVEAFIAVLGATLAAARPEFPTTPENSLHANIKQWLINRFGKTGMDSEHVLVAEYLRTYIPTG